MDVRILRSHLGLSNKQIAEILGVSTVTIWAWETGRSSPDALRIRLMRQLSSIKALKPDYSNLNDLWILNPRSIC